MKTFLFVLSILFTTLTFIGAIYVLASNGTTNAGYAVVPMVAALTCSNSYRRYNTKKNRSLQNKERER